LYEKKGGGISQVSHLLKRLSGGGKKKKTDKKRKGGNGLRVTKKKKENGWGIWTKLKKPLGSKFPGSYDVS